MRMRRKCRKWSEEERKRGKSGEKRKWREEEEEKERSNVIPGS